MAFREKASLAGRLLLQAPSDDANGRLDFFLAARTALEEREARTAELLAAREAAYEALTSSTS